LSNKGGENGSRELALFNFAMPPNALDTFWSKNEVSILTRKLFVFNLKMQSGFEAIQIAYCVINSCIVSLASKQCNLSNSLSGTNLQQ